MKNIIIASAVAVVCRVDADGKSLEDYFTHSESIGKILVTPIHKKSLGGKKKIIGHKEVVTGEIITKRHYYSSGNHYSSDGPLFLSSDVAVRDTILQLGDIDWKIYDCSPFEEEFTEQQLNDYLSQTPEEVKAYLKSLRPVALETARASLTNNAYQLR